MRFLVRQDDQSSHASTGETPEGRLDEVRTQGRQMLSAADEAIQRALAGSNSEAFLTAGRQLGGE